MKNIKTYKLFNESLKDKIVGKSNDELIKSLDDLKDSDKIKMIFKYKLSYDLLPDNLLVDGYLNCSNRDLTFLPEGLRVYGSLNCSNNILTSLPKGLVVTDDLSCQHNSLTSIPDNLRIGGDLYCDHNNLTSIPDNLRIGGDLYCDHNNLPKDFIKPKGVKGYLLHY